VVGGTRRPWRAARVPASPDSTEVPAVAEAPAAPEPGSPAPAYYWDHLELPDRPEQVVLLAPAESDLEWWHRHVPRAQLHVVGGAPAGWSQRVHDHPGDTASLESLARAVSPAVVVHRAGGAVDRMAALQALYPVLREHGHYVLEGLAEPEDATLLVLVSEVSTTLAGGTLPSGGDRARSFTRFCRATVASVRVRAGAVLLVKGSQPVVPYTRRSLAELAPGAHRVPTGAPYPRIPARLDGPTGLVGAAWERLLAAGPVTPADAVSAELTDVTVWGNRIAVTAEGHVVDETLNASRNVSLSGGLYRPFDDSLWVAERVPRLRTEHDASRRHVLLMQTWDNNFGHWLIDTLPRVGLVDSFGPRAEFTYVLSQPPDAAMRAVVVDSLALAGVAEEQLLFLPYGRHHFARLLVPGLLTAHPVTKSRMAVAFLEELAARVGPGPDRRVYLSRSAYSRRRLLDEERDLLPLLRERGFRVVRPEQLTFREQVSLLAGAQVVVGPMGAAMASLAFCPPGVTVLALATEAMEHDFFYDLVCLKDGRYRGLQGRAAQAPATLGSDFTVSPEEFDGALAWALDPSRPRP